MSGIDFEKYESYVNRMNSIRKEIKYHNEKKNDLEEEQNTIEAKVLKIMDALGTLTGRTTEAKVTVSETKAATFGDDQALFDWIALDPLTRLSVFQRRLHKGNIEDFIAFTGEAVPGVEWAVTRKPIVSKLPNT